MVAIASISSVTRMTPICAVIADPERPATSTATSTGPSSRMMLMPRMLTMKTSAPKVAVEATTGRRARPDQGKPTSAVTGNASAPLLYSVAETRAGAARAAESQPEEVEQHLPDKRDAVAQMSKHRQHQLTDPDHGAATHAGRRRQIRRLRDRFGALQRKAAGLESFASAGHCFPRHATAANAPVLSKPADARQIPERALRRRPRAGDCRTRQTRRAGGQRDQRPVSLQPDGRPAVARVRCRRDAGAVMSPPPSRLRCLTRNA